MTMNTDTYADGSLRHKDPRPRPQDVKQEKPPELKPCPFALSHRRQDIPSPPIYIRWVSQTSGFEVVCPRCGTVSPSFLDKSKAVECWNTRADLATAGDGERGALLKEFDSWLSSRVVLLRKLGQREAANETREVQLQLRVMAGDLLRQPKGMKA